MREPDEIKVRDNADKYGEARQWLFANVGNQAMMAWDNAFFEAYPAMFRGILKCIEYANHKTGINVPMKGIINEADYI